MSTDARDQRLRCGAAIRFVDPGGQARVILIDATPDLRQQALAHKITRCDAILFTHHHVDHIFGLDEVRRFNLLQNGPVEVHADVQTMGNLRRVYAHIFEREANANDSFVASLIARTIQPWVGFELFGLRITPIRLLHGRTPILGFRIDAVNAHRDGSMRAGFLPLAYCTDVSAIPPESWPYLEGLGTLVLDALRHRRHPTHLTVEQALGIAERVAPRQTFLTHIAHDLPHEETNAQLPEGVRLAHDGLLLG